MYKEFDSNVIIRLSDNAFIPKDEGNKDYIEYLKWKAAQENSDT